MTRPRRGRALLIGVGRDHAAGVRRLTADGYRPVRVVRDPSAARLRAEIAEFLDGCAPDELALLHLAAPGAIGPGGEHVFLAADTDPDDLAGTGVHAGFVDEQLEACRAAHAVAIVDSPPQRGETSVRSCPLTARGTYVLAGTGAFAERLAEAWRTAGSGGAELTADALFEHLDRRLRAAGERPPVRSAVDVDDAIALSFRARRAPGPAPERDDSERDDPDLAAVLGYYRRCLLAEEPHSGLIPVRAAGERYVVLPGRERLLSGELDDDGCAPVPPGAAAFLDEAERRGRPLWAGYPAVLLPGRAGAAAEFAPLLVRRVEPVGSGAGRRLRPVGPVLPHRGLARRRLGVEGTDALAAWFAPGWRGGRRARMAADVHDLLHGTYRLPGGAQPEPDALDESLDGRGDGARNVAVLFAEQPRLISPGAFDDLAGIAEQPGRVAGTALGALLDGDTTEVDEPPRPVLPWPADESQRQAVRTAMSRRLSTVTGPPGSGKTALVANLVATAVFTGQRVLVADADDPAVHEVWRRCAAVPGALVRTGAELADRIGPRPRRWARRAGGAADAWIFTRWRRASVQRALGIEPGDCADRDPRAICRAVAEFAAAEHTWREQRALLRERPDDQRLADALRSAQDAARTAAEQVLLASVRQQDDGDPAVRSRAATCEEAARLPLVPALFDLVVVDEAAHCGIAALLPLLFRARRAVVLGDAGQLAHVTHLDPAAESRIRRDLRIPADWLEERALSFRRHSAWHAAERATGGAIRLDEHHRCHPRIADTAAGLFPGEAQVVLTDIRGRPAMERPALEWRDVPGRACAPERGGSWHNPEEAAVVARVVAALRRSLPEHATIGVIALFRPQSRLLEQRLAGDPRVRIGTVHDFQGGECDAVVLSPVAAPGVAEGAARWLDRRCDLWHVAITRARSQLVVVGDATFWEGRHGIGADLLAAARRGHRAPEPDVHQRRLHELLPGMSVQLDQVLNGHRVDASISDGGVPLSVLLDRGPEGGVDPAEHLHRMLRRRELLDPEPGVRSAVRMPVWRLHDLGDTDDLLGLRATDHRAPVR
ncbi:AAA domain-containing protein [Saccharopolyspora sp. 6V]|uniref:AAA domain-containing protein n=1 Tax=Saccharopolyspora sp. 6V TaxID=2877239 RepID=UPI001CD6A774|nr:AAA domain-containing protein [Saccharopolyspora sp. 6V]MCA1193466.1 hypothetical protein [Saccharopolyspora sp. 6V]